MVKPKMRCSDDGIQGKRFLHMEISKFSTLAKYLSYKWNFILVVSFQKSVSGL